MGEEWLAGFPAWTADVLGRGISPRRFLILNATAAVLFTAGTLAALRRPRLAWFGAAFATLLGVNGALHALATLGLARYSPGTVTGVLLSIPLGAVVLRASSERLRPAALAASIGLGLLLHGAVALLAFL